MTIEIELPGNEERKFRFLDPSSTGVSAPLPSLLICDPTADKCAAAVAVRVGQLEDDKFLPGIAHLTEHMVFLGSRKFPQRNGLDSFLAQHGGYSNAYTDLEQTVYYFDCGHEHLEPALERWGACFTSPLLDEEAIAKEIQAVDSEHSKNITQDHWRLHQLGRQLLGSPTNHPYASFGTGNAESLGAHDTSTLQKSVQSFFESYYGSSNMACVVLGRESLDELQKLVENSFEGLQEICKSPPDYNLISSAHLPCLAMYKPVQTDTIHLELQFPMRELLSLYRQKPMGYVSHLIGHEGPGSLLYYFQKRQWAHSLSADHVSKSCKNFAIFTIQIELTRHGLEQWTEIVACIFSYLRLIREGDLSTTEQELRTTNATHFRFLSKHAPSDTVASLVSQLLAYSPEHVVSAPFILEDMDLPTLHSIMDEFMHAGNVLILLGHKDVQTDTEDPFYGTLFSSQALGTGYTENWTNPTQYSELYLPEPNDMLASDFEMIPVLPYTEESVPDCIHDSSTGRLWYKPDTTFSMPKVNMLFLLRSSLVYQQGPFESVLASLWSEIVQEICNEFSYSASMAGLHCDFSNTKQGIEIHVSGYNHKAHVLLQRIVDTIAKIGEKVTPNLFDRMKDKIRKQLQGFLVSQTYHHALYALDMCVEVPKWSVQSRLECVDSVTVEDLLNFSRQLLNRHYLEALVHGNLTRDDAMKVFNIVREKFPTGPGVQVPMLRVVRLPASPHCFRFVGWSPEDTNNCVLNLYQVGPMTTSQNAILSLLLHLLREPIFNKLRTEEQLGYIVHSQVKTNGDRIKSLMILVQSESYTCDHVSERIDAFLTNAREMIEKMPEEEFRSNKAAVKQSLLEKPKNLLEETSKYWSVIVNKTYQFQRLQEIAASLDAVTSVEAVLDLFDNIFSSRATRHELSIQVVGGGVKEQQPEVTQDQGAPIFKLITDPTNFTREHELFALEPEVTINVL